MAGSVSDVNSGRNFPGASPGGGSPMGWHSVEIAGGQRVATLRAGPVGADQ
ncbi:hypothetical protein ACIP1U_30250 [Cupriavidus sp. NPDC089707]|uniref:hypothetical protein n=1 Tax=Cupriavidus sp. NPDC089707 TaxID=3363963 RepID=UPI00380E5357